MQDVHNIQTDMKDDVSEQVQKIIIDTMKVPGKTAGDYAFEIKEKLDEVLKPTWHVVIGKSYGSDVIHEVFQYFNGALGAWQITIFKAGYL